MKIEGIVIKITHDGGYNFYVSTSEGLFPQSTNDVWHSGMECKQKVMVERDGRGAKITDTINVTFWDDIQNIVID